MYDIENLAEIVLHLPIVDMFLVPISDADFSVIGPLFCMYVNMYNVCTYLTHSLNVLSLCFALRS